VSITGAAIIGGVHERGAGGSFNAPAPHGRALTKA
jgi:hypothetical protein